MRITIMLLNCCTLFLLGMWRLAERSFSFLETLSFLIVGAGALGAICFIFDMPPQKRKWRLYSMLQLWLDQKERKLKEGASSKDPSTD